MTQIELSIKKKFSKLTNTEKKVANFLLNNISDIFRLPIAQLAKLSGVSQVTWVRFAKSLGFNGLKDLKIEIFNQLNAAATPADLNIVFQDIANFPKLSDVVDTIKSSSIQAVQDTSALINLESLDKIVDLFIDADSVCIFGVGASALVATDLAYKLLRIGKPVSFWSDFHLQLTYAATTKPGDICLFISNSGETVQVLEALEITKNRDCVKSISITTASDNQLASSTDFQLYTSSPEIDFRSGAMSSRIAQLAIVDILFTAIANRNYDNVRKNLEDSVESCRSQRNI